MKAIIEPFRHVSRCLCIIAAVTFFTCCRSPLNFDLETNDKRLLVDGEFTNDSAVHSIKLHRSGSFTTGRPQETVSGAVIYVTDEVDTFRYVESNTPGLYQTAGKCRGTGGHIYRLYIGNVDIDEDGKTEPYAAEGMMPVPVVFDSLVMTREPYNGYDVDEAVVNRAYYTIAYHGADYLYTHASPNNRATYGTLSDRLGTGEYSRFEKKFKIPVITNPETKITGYGYYACTSTKTGDTVCFTGYHLTHAQYKFLQEFDNNTNGDTLQDNYYDLLRIPSNLPTNIEPSDKAAGYFFIYSVSRISKVFEE